MYEEDLISVIVPVYNSAGYLDRCVTSIVGQTYRKLELILVDDGSSDESGRMCDRYAAGDARIKVIHKENGGLVSAWTAGFCAGTAPYVCFVDCDDYIEHDMLAKMAACLYGGAEFDGSQIICDSCVIDRPDGSSRKQYNGLGAGTYEYGRGIADNVLGNEIRMVCLSRCMKLISRKLIQDNLQYTDRSVRMGEDVTIMLPAVLDARRVVIMDSAFDYHYVYHGESMVHAYDPCLLENIHTLNGIIDRVFKDKKIKNGNEQREREYIFLMMLVIKNELRNPSADYLKRIQKICAEEHFREHMKNYPIEIHDIGTWVAANIMMHPYRWVIRAARAAMNRKMA